MRLGVVALGMALMLGSPFLSLYLFAGCPAIPNLVDCSLAGSLGLVLFEGIPVFGAAVSVLGLLLKGSPVKTAATDGHSTP